MIKVMDVLCKYNSKLGTQPIWKFVIIMFLSLLSVVPIYGAIEILLGEELIVNEKTETLGFIIISSCIIIPFFETLFFQLIPIWLINRFITPNLIVQIIIPAVIFGAAHYYSLGYIIFATLCGTVLCFGFCAYSRHRTLKAAFWSVALVHGLRNFLAIISTFIEL